MYYGFTPERLFPNMFLYLRTRVGIRHDDEALPALAELWPGGVELLRPFEDGQTWSNGVVFGLKDNSTPREVANRLESALSRFDAWALYSARGESAEWIGEGPIAAFLSHKRDVIAQIFLGFDNEDRPPEEVIDGLRAVYGEARCVPAFHFRDGRILLVDTKEPASMIFRRVQKVIEVLPRRWNRRQLPRYFLHFSCCDCSGDSFVPDDRQIWKVTGVLFRDTDWS